MIDWWSFWILLQDNSNLFLDFEHFCHFRIISNITYMFFFGMQIWISLGCLGWCILSSFSTSHTGNPGGGTSTRTTCSMMIRLIQDFWKHQEKRGLHFCLKRYLAKAPKQETPIWKYKPCIVNSIKPTCVWCYVLLRTVAWPNLVGDQVCYGRNGTGQLLLPRLWGLHRGATWWKQPGNKPKNGVVSGMKQVDKKRHRPAVLQAFDLATAIELPFPINIVTWINKYLISYSKSFTMLLLRFITIHLSLILLSFQAGHLRSTFGKGHGERSKSTRPSLELNGRSAAALQSAGPLHPDRKNPSDLSV